MELYLSGVNQNFQFDKIEDGKTQQYIETRYEAYSKKKEKLIF